MGRQIIQNFSATSLAGIAALFFLAVINSPVVEAQNPCSAIKMWENYRAMIRANCRNCDKYFHCQGNYEAVYKCSGPFRETTAAAISNLREWYQGGGSSGSGNVDSAADQAANRFGRGGGNCASRYLRNVKCAYNPKTKACK